MTELGKFLNKKSVNKAEISRRTGIKTSRLSDLCHDSKTRLMAEEVFLIALAMDIEPDVVLKEVCKSVKLIKSKPNV